MIPLNDKMMRTGYTREAGLKLLAWKIKGWKMLTLVQRSLLNWDITFLVLEQRGLLTTGALDTNGYFQFTTQFKGRPVIYYCLYHP